MTASVTGCSTWMRPFSSRKKNCVAVEDELDRPGAAVADRAPEGDRGLVERRRVERGRGAAPAIPRAPSGAVAAPSSRARRARRRSRARRRGAAPRRGAGARGSARSRACRRRRRPPPRAPPPRARRRARPASGRPACRARRLRRPPSRAAGSRSPPGAPSGSTGTPASRAIRFAASLSPPSRSALGRRADPRQPCGLDGLGEVRVLREEAVAGMDRVGARARAPRGCAPPSGGTRRSRRVAIGRAGVQRGGVVRRGDRDGLDPELAARAEDAHAISPRFATSSRRIGTRALYAAARTPS